MVEARTLRIIRSAESSANWVQSQSPLTDQAVTSYLNFAGIQTQGSLLRSANATTVILHSHPGQKLLLVLLGS